VSAAAVFSGAAQVQDCSMGVLPAGWPPLQVLALFPPRQPGAAPDLARQAARRLARQLVLERFGVEAPGLPLQAPRATCGARTVSFSHEAGVSLLAWCPSGTVGIDLVGLDSLALASPQELAATAALYLGPQACAEVAAATTAGEARRRFALRWAGHEARLKCLGLELDEWRPALARWLGAAGVVQVTVADQDGSASGTWIGCVAWRAGAPTCTRD
jgi:phosphopantetheinyl transferase (holo-ACP synthase)